jgi:hypothetical protein
MVVILKIEVCIGNKRMVLFAKRFRSKVPLAASLSLGQLVDRHKIGFDSLPIAYSHKVSRRRGKG